MCMLVDGMVYNTPTTHTQLTLYVYDDDDQPYKQAADSEEAQKWVQVLNQLKVRSMSECVICIVLFAAL